jgi:hypothetical protein
MSPYVNNVRLCGSVSMRMCCVDLGHALVIPFVAHVVPVHSYKCYLMLYHVMCLPRSLSLSSLLATCICVSLSYIADISIHEAASWPHKVLEVSFSCCGVFDPGRWCFIHFTRHALSDHGAARQPCIWSSCTIVLL